MESAGEGGDDLVEEEVYRAYAILGPEHDIKPCFITVFVWIRRESGERHRRRYGAAAVVRDPNDKLSYVQYVLDGARMKTENPRISNADIFSIAAYRVFHYGLRLMRNRGHRVLRGSFPLERLCEEITRPVSDNKMLQDLCIEISKTMKGCHLSALTDEAAAKEVPILAEDMSKAKDLAFKATNFDHDVLLSSEDD